MGHAAHGRPASRAAHGMKAGAKVIAGTMNGSGSLRVQVGGSGERIALAGMRLVQQAQTSRSRAQALTDRPAE